MVRLTEGDFDKIKIYQKDPIDQLKFFVDIGFSRIHIIDLDGAKEGVPKNLELFKSMIKHKDNTTIEMGGGIRSIEIAKMLFDIGIDYLIVGTMAIKDKENFLRLLELYKNKIILSVDAKDGKVAIGGWQESTALTPCQLANIYDNYPIESYLYTNINIDGVLKGIDINPYKVFRECTTKPIIASGGVGSIEDVIKLKDITNYVVVGKAIYENKIDLKAL